jgi:hypothetical protein
LRTFRILLACLITLISFTAKAGWVNQNTGINDELTAVKFWNSSNGIISGKNGIYYTTTGGFGSTSWTRFNISTNSSDSVLYNNCQFNGVSSNSSNQAYVCGTDTVNQRAIILHLNILTLNYTIKYLGQPGSSLNAILDNGTVYAVGDNGLVVKGNLAVYNVLTSGITNNLYSVKLAPGGIGIGGDGVYLHGLTAGSSMTLTTYLHPGKIFRGVQSSSATAMLTVGAGMYRLDNSGATLTELTNYDGPLNAQDFIYYSGVYMIATDHGIYIGGIYTNYYEFAVTSGGLDINGLCMLNTSEAYGVGPNGLLIKTTNGGIPVKPFAQVNVVPNCKGDVTNLSGNPGSATSCKWLLNSTLIANGCNVNYTFNTAGIFTLSYVVWNTSGLYDTVNQTINIINPPAITIGTSALDTVLCKQEVIHVVLDSTQNDFIYDLRKYGSSLSLGQVTGSSNPDTITSSLISTGGNYYVKVMSTLSQCSRNLSDTIKITVEKPVADFRVSVVNAIAGENVSFYNNSKEADNFKWDFPVTCNTMSSTDSEPTGISFNATGSTLVKLTSWSDAGCYDSIIAAGPGIYEIPEDDSCWAYNIDANNVAWTGYYTSDIAGAAKTDDGYLVCGTGYEIMFTSRLGTTPPRTSNGGFYLARYTNDGVLKWYGASRDNTYASYTIKPVLNSVTTDEHGNIYIVGKGKGSVYYYTPNGDSIQFAYGPSLASNYSYGFVVKLDSLGNFIWKGVYSSANPGTIKIAPNGDIIIVGERSGGASSFFHNGSTYTIPATASANYFLMRLDSNGYAKWHAPIALPHTNTVQCSDFAIDLQSNVLLTGSYEYASTFYSPDLSVTKTIPYIASNYGAELFLVKYDSLGIPQWSAYQLSSDPSSFSNGVVSDSLGNSYITGSFQSSNSGLPMKIISSDGTQSNHAVGGYWLMKFSPSGMIQWCVGNQYSYYGQGQAVTLHNGELSVVGGLRENSGLPFSCNLTSTDGTSTPVTMYRGDYFVATYSTSGVLSNVTLTGENDNTYDPGNKMNIFRDNLGRTYITGNMLTSNGFPVNYFGDDVIPNGLYDGFVAKMGIDGCGEQISVGIPAHLIPDIKTEVFPNPAVDAFNIVSMGSDNIVSVSIFDLLGALVYKKNISDKTLTINKSEFTQTPGVYFIEIIDSRNVKSVHKLILQ